MEKENYQSILQIDLQYQILKLVSDIAKSHAFQAELMPKMMNHTKIGKSWKIVKSCPLGPLPGLIVLFMCSSRTNHVCLWNAFKFVASSSPMEDFIISKVTYSTFPKHTIII